ncbi:hypothetical protein ACIA8O_27000 [Kitasatospora sp. NPDC051853]|uniref:hypothetical protein n=1 Tax=Kitasatospora sp. NPDC051853 TaxID=3364058 RepID=UPI0037B5067F
MKLSGRAAVVAVLVVAVAAVVAVAGVVIAAVSGQDGPPDPRGRWAGGGEVVELLGDGTLGEVAVSPSICSSSAGPADGPPRSVRGTWRAGSFSDAGTGVYVTFDDLRGDGRSCTTYLQFVKVGAAYRLGANARDEPARFVRSTPAGVPAG